MRPASRVAFSTVSAAVAVLAWVGTASADRMSDLVAAARAEGQLNVIALPRDWCGYGGIIDAFKARYGLRVVELDPDAGSAVQIEAIRGNSSSSSTLAPDVIDVGLAFGPP